MRPAPLPGRPRPAWLVARLGPWALAVAAAAWVGLLWQAPRWSGEAGGAARLASAAAYVTGATVCHQRAGRSFARAGAALPVCARCTGLYAGAAVGALIAAMVGARRLWPASRYRGVFAVAVAPTALAWGLEWLAGVEVGNAARALAAWPAGALAGWMLASALGAWPPGGVGGLR